MLEQMIAASLHACSRLCTLLALVVMLTGAVGSTLSDRFFWSQFLAYIPTTLYTAVAAGLVFMAALLYAIRRRLSPAPRRARLLLIAATAFALQLVYLGVIEFRLYRLPWRQNLQAAAARPGGLRVLYWNASSAQDADLPTTMTSVPSDLAVTANPAWERSFADFAQAYGTGWVLNAGQFVILSRNPILRWGVTDLGLSGRQQVAVGEGEFDIRPRGGLDTGQALWLQIDTQQVLGRSTVVWVLDLPSDERAGRWANALAVAAAMRNWPGPARISNASSITVATEPAQGFPAPDLVLGDFNTPRGSASLSIIAPGLKDAYAQAGAGYAATFPRRRPLLHIDLMLSAPWLRADDYRVIDPDRGKHRMQWARFEPR